MTAPRSNGRQLEAAAVLPEEVVTNLNLADKHCRLSLELANLATSLDPEIREAQQKLDALKARHSQLGADSTKNKEVAEGYHEMAIDRCKKYGYGPMPAPFEDLLVHLSQQMERNSPVAIGISDTKASPIMPTPLDDPNHKVGA
jgi:hypothetical protein